MRDISELFSCENDYSDLDISGAAQRLSAAIRCRTVNDGKDYAAFSELQSIMRQGFPALMSKASFELIGRSVLITVTGTDSSLSPVLFMSHQDVVPVVRGTDGDWTYPPFSGAVADGFIWGRGTLDIKQMVFGILEAAEYLISRGKSFGRTVYFAFGEDEETYNTGAKAISDVLKSRGVKLEYLLDEGGGTISSGKPYGAPDIFVSDIAIMEKGYADLELSVKSQGGHSSRPFGGTSLGRLAEAISAIANKPFPAELSPTIYASFAALKPYITQEPIKTLVGRMEKEPAALAEFCMGIPELFPQVTTTIAPTMISGSSAACNVMPQDMEAVVNLRIAEGHNYDEVMEHCARVVDNEQVSIRFLQANNPSQTARIDGFGYTKLVETMSRYYKDVVFIPGMSVGATDAHCYEQICDVCLRCSPFMGNEDEVRRGVHGTDEKISLRAYAQGIRTLIYLMENTCL